MKPFLPEDQSRGGAELVYIAKCLLKGGTPGQAAAIAEADPLAPARSQRILKAAIAAGSTANESWAGNLTDYKIAADGFLESLRTIGLFDRVLPDMRKIPLRTRAIAVTAAASGTLTGEGSLKPVSRLSLAGAQLAPVKATCIIVLSEELLRVVAEGFLSRELRLGVAAATDSIFVDILKASTTPVPSSAGDYDAIKADSRRCWWP
jgi:hypothetical protein